VSRYKEYLGTQIPPFVLRVKILNVALSKIPNSTRLALTDQTNYHGRLWNQKQPTISLGFNASTFLQALFQDREMFQNISEYGNIKLMSMFQ